MKMDRFFRPAVMWINEEGRLTMCTARRTRETERKGRGNREGEGDE